MCQKNQRWRGNKRTDKRRNKRKDVTTLGFNSGLWAGGQGPLVAGVYLVVWVLWWQECTARCWPPLLLYPSGACLVASWKFSKMSLWEGGRGRGYIGGLTVSLWRQVLNLLVFMTRWVSLANTLPLQGFARLSHSLIKMRKFPKHNAWFRSLLNSRIFISFWRRKFARIAHPGLGMFVTTADPSLGLHKELNPS